MDALPFYEVVKCRLVAKLIRDIIDGSNALQYKIELVLAGKEDGGKMSLTTAAKREILRKYQEARFTLSPSFITTLEITDLPSLLSDDTWEMFDNILSVEEADTVRLTLFPSKVMGSPERTMNLPRLFLGKTFTYVAFEPFEMLVMMDSEMDDDYSILVYQIQREPPFEARPVPLNVGKYGDDPAFRANLMQGVEIHGDLIAIVSVTNEWSSATWIDGTAFQVFNWRTGECLMGFDSYPGFKCFTWYNRALIIAAMSEENEAWLSFVEISPEACPQSNHSGPRFLFPKLALAAKVRGLAVEVRPHPSDDAERHPMNDRVFYPKRDLKPFVLTLYLHNEMGNSRTVHFVIEPDLLHQKYSAVSKDQGSFDIPWESWGTSVCRMMTTLEISDPFCCMSGSVVVNLEKDVIVLCDFNRFAAKKASQQISTAASHEPSASPQSRVISGPTYTVDADFFATSFTSSLPYVKYVTNFRIPDGSKLGGIGETFVWTTPKSDLENDDDSNITLHTF